MLNIGGFYTSTTPVSLVQEVLNRTGTCKISYPTGLYVPVEKRSLFMVAFEDKLVLDFNVVPVFGQVCPGNTCEVKLNYLKSKSHKPGSLWSDMDKAVDFLKSNIYILSPTKSANRKKPRTPNIFEISPQVINLEEDCEEKSMDCINIADDPEVIILDDSVGETTRSSISIVDLTESSRLTNNSNITKETDSEITVLEVKRNISEISQSKQCPTPPNKRCCSTKPGSPSNSTAANTFPKKKRKLEDISNMNSSATCNSSPSSHQQNLSGNAMKYYKNIAKIANIAKLKKSDSNTDFIPVIKRNDSKSFCKNENLKKSNLCLKVSLGANEKRKVFMPQNSSTSSSSNKITLGKKSISSQSSPCRKFGKSLRKKLSETNSFNPNPYEVDLEGLRPVVIDGCNVAIKHGKGVFSPKGLDICVDYFASRGHSHIKIFLPQFRQEQIPKEILTALKSKCDVVFTPSHCIDGQRRTPYDDRFIVQYATEFGGVIVSTDNYRDIAKENPRWKDTIAKRLLMFTWVDDFLMFPVDPLGRSGPTLDNLLKFS